MKSTKVRNMMTGNPVLVSPDTTLQEAAAKMRDIGCGILPVGTEDRLEGVITDRDIAVRAIAIGKDPAAEYVRNFMTERVIVCHENDTLETAADKMHTHQVSRLIVQDDDGKVAGILSLGSMLRKEPDNQRAANIVRHAVPLERSSKHSHDEEVNASVPRQSMH